MKILQINTGVFPIPPPKGGGTEFHIYKLSQKLADFGCYVDLVSDIYDDITINKNINIKRTRSLRPSLNAGFFGWILTHFFGGLLSSKKAINEIFKNRYDVIHIHSRLNGFFICLIENLLKKKLNLVYTLHNPGPWLGEYDSKFEEIVQKIAFILFDLYVCNKVDRIIVVGNDISKELVRRWKIDKNKINVIHNGVDPIVNMPDTKEIKKVEKKYNINGDYMLFVGQLHKRKGVHYLIHAMEHIEYLCVIVGEGPEKNSLKYLVNNKKLSNIILTGAVPRSDLICLFAGATMFILPSTAEALPLTILEAMSVGLPIISSNVGAISEILVNNVNGVLVEPRNIPALRSSIRRLLQEPELLMKMGEYNKKVVREQYDWKVISKEVLNLYRKGAEIPL